MTADSVNELLNTGEFSNKVKIIANAKESFLGGKLLNFRLLESPKKSLNFAEVLLLFSHCFCIFQIILTSEN